MDAVDASTEISVAQRLPSTKPIDERWDRSRCLILRNAEQTALHDFRWTHNDSTTFTQVPASSRNYARRELTRRSTPESTSSRTVQGGQVGRPEQVNISVVDRLTQAQNEISQLKSERRADQDAVQRESASVRQEKAEFDAAQKEGHKHLREEWSKLDDMKKQALLEAELRAKGAYEKKHADLKKEVTTVQEEKELLKNGWIELEATKAATGAKIADAISAAETKVEDEHRGLLNSALSKDRQAANAKEEAKQLLNSAKNEAKQLLDDAKQNEENAITDRSRLSNNHQRELDDAQKRFNEFLDNSQEAIKREQALAIGNFTEKLENAEYREHVERSDYDGYREIWDGLVNLTASFRKELGTVSVQLRDAARAWNLVERFEKAHPLFGSKYPNLRAQIRQHTRTSREQAVVAYKNAEQWERTFAEDIRPKLVDQAHFSRMLTRTTRFDKSPSPNATVEVVGQILCVQPMEDLKRTLSARKKELKDKLREGGDEADVVEPIGEIAEIDKQYTLVKALERLLSTLTKYQSFKFLRAGSSREKEIWDTTNAVDRRRGEAFKQWREFQRYHPRFVIESEVDEEAQNKDRQSVKQSLRATRAEFDQLRDTVQEASLLEQQLGEGEERVALIDAELDKEINGMHKLVRKQLGQLVGETVSKTTFAFGTGSWSAHRPAEPRRRSIAAAGARTMPPAISAPKPAPSVSLRTTSGSALRKVETGRQAKMQDETTRLTMELKDGATYKTDADRQQAEEKLKRLKQETMRRELELLKGRRTILHKTPGSDPQKLEIIERNIEGVTKSLAANSSSLQQAASGASLVVNRHAWRKRQSRAAARARTLVSSKSDLSSESGNAASPVLSFKPTASQQAWHPLRISQTDPYGYDLKKRIPAQGSNSAMISRMLAAPLDNTTFVPRALRVYSLHSLHTVGHAEQTASDPHIDSASNPTTSIMQSFDESIVLTQSSIDAVSNPESDDSYEPSDSEGSVAGSEPVVSSQETTNAGAASSIPSTQEFADALEAQPPTDTALPPEQNVSNLTYNISGEDYRRAVMASKSTNAAFWTYKLYKNAEGKTPTIHYCITFETAETQAKQFLNEPMLGFDLEWEVGSSPGKSSIKRCVSLVQIASETKIGLFQLAMFKGDTAEQLMPPSLRKILESREVTKTGVNISGDASRIEKCFGFKMQGIFELSHLYNVVTWSEKSPERVNKKLLKLADQVQNVLLLPLKKDAVRVSKWSQRLRPEQTEYAASDAYAGFRIYHTLEAKRKIMDPTPPRPAFWEDKKPLVLGDGTVVVPRKVVKTKVDTDGKVVEDEDDEGEEYFDAVETLDSYELDTSATAGIPLEGLSISYPTLPTLAEPPAESPPANPPHQSSKTSDNPSPATTSTPTPIQSDTKPKPTPLSSPAVTAADTWAQHFRNSLPATHDLKTKQAHLRAYHLWHHQRHECKDVASLLRDPPLSVTTVASYVLQTVAEGKERLDYDSLDRARIEVVLGLLPSSVRGKYGWVVERMERKEVERGMARGDMYGSEEERYAQTRQELVRRRFGHIQQTSEQ